MREREILILAINRKALKAPNLFYILNLPLCHHDLAFICMQMFVNILTFKDISLSICARERERERDLELKKPIPNAREGKRSILAINRQTL